MKKYTLDEVYTADMTAFQRERYNRVADEFEKLFGEKPTAFFSAPGRTEVGGNHTDHNFGCVLAAGVSLDVIAAVAPDNEENVITIKSEGFPMDTVNVDDDTIYEEQKNTSAALIRGMSAGFKKNGHNAGGFKAYATSNVLKGSGLSSSAAYEVLIGTILNGLYNEGEVSAVEIAQIAQFAENVYFGKPSGLMDQMASSVGGFITIDFADEKHPVIDSVKFDFTKSGHALCIVDTKGNHADLKKVDAKKATYTKEGNITYWYCDDCGKYYSDAEATREITKADTVIPRKTHSSNSGSTGSGADVKKGVQSSKTGDAGVALYAAMSLLSLTGGAVVLGRKRKAD